MGVDQMSIKDSLTKIADCLQMDFVYENGNLLGDTNATVTLDLGVEVPLKLRPTKVFFSDQCGVLVKVSGDLSILVSHFPKTGMISAYLIDGNKLEMGGAKTPAELFLSKKMTLKEAIAAFGRAVSSSFYFKDGWKPLKLPN